MLTAEGARRAGRVAILGDEAAITAARLIAGYKVPKAIDLQTEPLRRSRGDGPHRLGGACIPSGAT